MKKIIILSIFLCFAFKSMAQTDLNNYKYVVVPLQYDFLKGQDVYRLNTLTKFLFKEGGYDVYFEKQQLPEDLFSDRCLALYADVKEVKGGFRKTRLEIILKDCHGELIMKSEVGQSGENNHEKSHHIALRNAFKSIDKLKYKYEPKLNDETEVKAMPKKKEINKTKEPESKQNAKLKRKITTQDVENKKEPLVKKNSDLLSAIAIDNGFQLRDEDNRRVMILLKTAAKNVFIVKGKDAIVFRENDKWIYSENDGDVMLRNFLNIKF